MTRSKPAGGAKAFRTVLVSDEDGLLRPLSVLSSRGLREGDEIVICLAPSKAQPRKRPAPKPARRKRR